jgi:hypothetical protein
MIFGPCPRHDKSGETTYRRTREGAVGRGTRGLQVTSVQALLGSRGPDDMHAK